MTSQLEQIIPDNVDEALRDFVRSAYRNRPEYSWLYEDILEELEEVVSEELEICRSVYPSSF